MTDPRRRLGRELTRGDSAEQTSGKGVSQSEFQLGIGRANLSRWRRQLAAHGEDAFRGFGRVVPEQEWLRRLECENEMLAEERDVLESVGRPPCASLALTDNRSKTP